MLFTLRRRRYHLSIPYLRTVLSSETFFDSIQKNCGWKNGEPVLAAVSGGPDSMVLCELLLQNKIPFSIAHVNYGLRGNESDEDEIFLSDFAREKNLRFYLHRCSENELNETGESSVQAAARKIRYSFFEETAAQNGFQHIAVAHQADDTIETALLNFARGTGMAGMTGMDFRNGKIIRPMLNQKRNEILAFAEKNKLKWREDSSNAADDYTRNKFRHHILPWLANEIPQGYKGFESSMNRFRRTEKLIEAALSQWENSCCKKSGDEIHIQIEAALQFPQPYLFLSFFLERYGFNAAQTASLETILSGESGKQLLAAAYKLIRHRDYFILVPQDSAKKKSEPGLSFTLENFDGKIAADKTTAIVDADAVSGPLLARRWENGDKLIPFGMNGHRNLSDILNEMKLPPHEKENTFVVVSGTEIVWIPGYRIAEKFRVTEKTKKIWRIKFNDNHL